MLFSLDNDDFQDLCIQEAFPLLRIIAFHLNKKANASYPNPDVVYDFKMANLIKAYRKFENQE